MTIEVVAIGNEILRGAVVNTNATFISRELAKAGWLTCRHTVLPDDLASLKQALKEALNRSTIVIATGGLGPTVDDLSRLAAADIFSSELIYDERVGSDLKKRFGPDLQSLEDQAKIPKGAIALLNPVGTAPAIILQRHGNILILLPGVPVEMEAIFKEKLLPFLRAHLPFAKSCYTKEIHIALQTESSIDPILRDIRDRHPEVEIGIYPSYGTVSVYLKGEDADLLAKLKEKITQTFDTFVFEAPDGKIEEAVHLAMIVMGKTLALAESCTGGAIAARLTALPGASDYFLGSLVTYSNEWKAKFLALKERTLHDKGAVSKDTVLGMLEGLFENTGADVALAVSGVAGPSGGTAAVPVGTIWAAFGERGKPCDAVTFRILGNRQKIIQVTSSRLLAALWRKMIYNQSSFSS